MTTRLVHISDLHFPARNPEQREALTQAVAGADPGIVVVTGDLTRHGSRSEFLLAAEFVGSLPGRKLVVPGNHDAPVSNLWQRLYSPFGRFNESFATQGNAVLETPDAIVVGINTAFGMRLALDWSLGHAAPGRIAAACRILEAEQGNRLRIVACHHPLLPDPVDPKRSRTSRGHAAFGDLAQAGMDILLHGHLHRALSTLRVEEGRRVQIICASTALSDRERGGTSGFNILELDRKFWKLTPMIWQDHRYVPDPR